MDGVCEHFGTSGWGVYLRMWVHLYWSVDLSRWCVDVISGYFVCLIVWVYDSGHVYECVHLSWGKIYLSWSVCKCERVHVCVCVTVSPQRVRKWFVCAHACARVVCICICV